MDETPKTVTLEGDPSVILNEPTTVFVNQAPVFYPVRKNVAAQVIGWIFVVIGCFYVLMSPMIFIDLGVFTPTDINGNPIIYSLPYKITSFLFGISSSVMMIIGSYKMTNYEKKGIWIIFASFALSWIGSVILSFFAPDMGLGVFGTGVFSAIAGIICYSFCGAIVAIPLMLSDGGME